MSAFAGCADGAQEPAKRATNPLVPSAAHPSNANPRPSAAGSSASSAAAGSAAPAPAAAGAPAAQPGGNPVPTDGSCAVTASFKKEGCPCKNGETAACWTGPAADRNVGTCHDGLQICRPSGDNEFASWGPCMGEQHSCGTDAGVPPPPPPPDEDCSCIPGAVIQCSEDCSVGIICSLTATKTCLPDKTWSVCREDANAMLDLPGFQCRNMLHGCLDIVTSDTPASQTELYVGDCSKQFKCGHAPGAAAAGAVEELPE